MKDTGRRHVAGELVSEAAAFGYSYTHLPYLPSTHNVQPPSRFTMSSTSNTSTLQSNIKTLFDTALDKYAKRTGQDLCNHPLAAAIDRCGSPDEILAIFQAQSHAFDEFRNGDPKLVKWLRPVVNGLHAHAP